MKKGSSLILLALIIFTMQVCFPIHGNALDNDTSKLKLSLEESINKALEYTHRFVEIDQSIKTMQDQYGDLLKLSATMKEQIANMDDYAKLYEKNQTKALDIEEQRTFRFYRMVYGPTPPRLNSEELFNNYIVNRDFKYYSLWAAIQTTKTNKELLKASITKGVRTLYDQLLVLHDTLALQQDLYNVMDKQNSQLILKFQQGQASELDKYLSETGLGQQKLAIEKLQRTIDNTEMIFKQQVGIPLTQSIELEPYDANAKLKSTVYYWNYLEKAAANRSEIVSAKMDLTVKQRELDITKQYIQNELVTERLEAQLTVDDKNIALQEAKDKVAKDIYTGYVDVVTKQQNVFVASSKKANAERQYNETNFKYNQGLIALSTLWNVEIQQTQAKIEYVKAVNDYNNALYMIELASGVGPQYSTK